MINAVVDALSHLGVTDIQMPATPERVWRAIEEAKAVIPAAFDYEVAESVDHAIELLGTGGDDAKLLAGGHSLIPALKLRIARPSKLVDIGRLADLSYVRDDGTAHRDRRADAPQGRRRGSAPRRSTARSSRSPPGRSATRRCATAGRSAARSRTAIRPRTCRR